jgi:hypothetical protein
MATSTIHPDHKLISSEDVEGTARVELLPKMLAKRFRGDADDGRDVGLGHAAAGHGLDHLALRLARLEGRPPA